MTEEKEKMSTGKKIVIGFICVLFVLTAAVYFAGVYYFSNHFMPGSMVNGFHCSFMSEEETEELLSRNVQAYVLTLNTRNHGVESITAEQAGLTYTSDGSVKNLIKNQPRFTWFMNFPQKETYQMIVRTSVDEGKLTEAINGLNCMKLVNVTLASNAFIKETDTGYEIVPEVQGNQLNFGRVYETVSEAMTTGVTTVDLEEKGCYEAPTVFADDEKLIANCDFMNEVTDIIITYDFADRTETVDKDVIKNWFTWDSEGYCVLDKEQIMLFVSNLAYTYDTVGNIRSFRTYDGRQIEISGGDYGWVVDQDAEVDALVNAIMSGETQVRQPIYSTSAWCRDSNDIGYSYIEVDLTNQRMVLYLNGVPTVDTPIISGNPNYNGAETPVGCYSIKDMQSQAMINCEGFNASVGYVMTFAGNLGIHDAAWRNGFGSTLYLWDGSYGCIHAPYEKVASIYGKVSSGFPVVIYK